MGKRVRAFTMVMSIAAAILVGSSSTTHAIHGLSDNHVADQDITYRLHSVSLNSAQRTAIEDAADEWRSEMGKSLGGLNLDRGSNYTGTTPKAFRDQSSSTRLVWEDNYPSSFAPECVYPEAIACAEFDWPEVPDGDDHLTDVDIVYHEDIYWPSGDFECAAGQGDPDALDISDGAADQFTIALHEFGHAFHLKDAGSSGSLMNASADGICWRDISNHDRDTAFDVYGYITDPGHSHVGH